MQKKINNNINFILYYSKFITKATFTRTNQVLPSLQHLLILQLS